MIGIDPALRLLYHAACIVARARRWAAAAAGGASFRVEPSDEINFSPIRALAKSRAARAQLGDLHGLQPDQRRAARGRAAPGHTHKNGAIRADCALPPLQKKPLTTATATLPPASENCRRDRCDRQADRMPTPPDPDLQLLAVEIVEGGRVAGGGVLSGGHEA